MKGSPVLLILMLDSIIANNNDQEGSMTIKNVVQDSIQATYFRDNPRNYNQKSIYRKTSQTSQRIALHNSIFKKAVADVIRNLNVSKDDAFVMVRKEMINSFGKQYRPKPGGFPEGRNGLNINNGINIPFLPPPECNEDIDISCMASKYYTIDGKCNNLRFPT